ncbi:hypothetical protein Fmac_009075 [Flemingia macrophylla]|uniref:Cytochrome b5 heme-binding domain-containing protein n=1 Tax=Flemingia macrophylla TaxID=520843 RepID=A0ABD1N1N4_9FABA
MHHHTHASTHPPTAATTTRSTIPTTTSTEEAASRDAATSYISSSHLRNHSTSHAAWISIDGAIYDVTEWLHRHPGGSLPVFTLAGRDATDAFQPPRRPSCSRGSRRTSATATPPSPSRPRTTRHCCPSSPRRAVRAQGPHHSGAPLHHLGAPGPLGGGRRPLRPRLRARTLRGPDGVGLHPPSRALTMAHSVEIQKALSVPEAMDVDHCEPNSNSKKTGFRSNGSNNDVSTCGILHSIGSNLTHMKVTSETNYTDSGSGQKTTKAKEPGNNA